MLVRLVVVVVDAAIVFFMLAESVAERLRDHGLMARTVQISLRDNGLYSFERQCKLRQPTCISGELHAAAMKLLHANYNWIKPLRSIGIRAMDLVPIQSPLQLSLFEEQVQREKVETLERTIDDIRRRFGHYSVVRAVCTMDDTLHNINPKDEHTIHPVGYFKAV